MAAYSALARKVYEMHILTETQQVAVDTYVGYVLNCDLVWTEEGAEAPLDPADEIVWRDTMTRILRQMLIYGYALCRAVRVRRDAKGEVAEATPDVRIEVARGIDLVPSWNGETVSFNFTGLSSGTKMSPDKGWYVIMLAEPLLDERNEPIMHSGAARAYEMSKRIRDLEANFAERDRLNTTATVLIEKANTGGHDPTDRSARDPTMTLLHGNEGDLRTWAYHQKELMNYLGELSRKGEEDNRKRYAAAQSRDPKRARIDPTKTLLQLPVDRGMTASEITARQAPPDYTAVVTGLQNDIMWAFGVPPNIKAMKVNSERASSADRMMQMIMADFERFVHESRGLLQGAITTVSRQLSKSDCYVYMKPRMSAFVLQQISSVLRIDALRSIKASVFRVPADIFDPKLLKMEQMLALEGSGGPANRKQNAHDVDGGGNAVASDAEKSQSHTLKHA
jgi:hypothetical protein